MLTQRAPELPLDTQSNPAFPESLAQPFLDIVRHALRLDPKSRWTLAEVRASLNPAAIAAVAGQSTSTQAASPSATSGSASAPSPATTAPMPPSALTAAPLPVAPAAASPASVAVAAVLPTAVPLSPVQAVPAAKLPTPRYDAPPPKPQGPRRQPAAASAPKQALVLPNYVVPVLAVTFIIVAIIALPKILARRPASSSATSAASSQPASQPAASEPAARRVATPPSGKSGGANSVKTAADKKSSGSKTLEQKAAEPSLSAKATAPAVAPSSLRTDTPASAKPEKTVSASAAHGEVLDQVLPEVSEKARATIQGRVRLSVRAHVDAAGNVTDAELDSPGPSKYFADLAAKAVRHWVFTPPEVDGRSVPSEWLIHFIFTQSDTKALPNQTAP